jgi:hypothetical protein
MESAVACNLLECLGKCMYEPVFDWCLVYACLQAMDEHLDRSAEPEHPLQPLACGLGYCRNFWKVVFTKGM